MLNLKHSVAYQYNFTERLHLKSLRSKYGRKFQNVYGESKKRVWYDGELASLRIKHNIIKSLLLGSRFRCAYCSKLLVRSEKPVDHFIPNSIYPELSFHELNLIPSCGYCNSSLKKMFDPIIIKERKYSKSVFFICHPIIHNINQHICYKENDVTQLDLEKCSIEGLNTIELFKLYRFEMIEERINQFIINRDNPLTDEKLIRLVNECATYQYNNSH